MYVQSLRHSPISPVHNRKDGSFDHSTISPQPGLDSAALTHSPVSRPTEAANEKLSHIPLLPAAQEHREESPVRQAAPLEAENTSADKAPQELPGEVALQGRASRLSAPDAPLQEAAATKGAEQGLSGDQVAATEHMLDSKAAQKAQEPSKAGHKGVEGISEPALGSPMLQENGRSVMQQAATAEPPSSSRGALQRNAASPTAAASQQITSEAAQRAEERLKELVLGADYSEKNWFYVDPQVKCHLESPIALFGAPAMLACSVFLAFLCLLHPSSVSSSLMESDCTLVIAWGFVCRV